MATRSSISPSRFRRQLQRINKHIDWLIVGLLLCILLASFFPAKGSFATGMHYASKVFLFLLFFFYGAKLAPRETLLGLKNWRLHAVIFCFTFILFPIIGVGLKYATIGWLGQGLALGLLYLTLVPGTVQPLLPSPRWRTETWQALLWPPACRISWGFFSLRCS